MIWSDLPHEHFSFHELMQNCVFTSTSVHSRTNIQSVFVSFVHGAGRKMLKFARVLKIKGTSVDITSKQFGNGLSIHLWRELCSLFHSIWRKYHKLSLFIWLCIHNYIHLIAAWSRACLGQCIVSIVSTYRLRAHSWPTTWSLCLSPCPKYPSQYWRRWIRQMVNCRFLLRWNGGFFCTCLCQSWKVSFLECGAITFTLAPSHLPSRRSPQTSN